MFKLAKRIKNKKRGFTLIELIVVIAILGILAAILVPTMIGIVKDSKAAVNLANARSVYSAAQGAYVSLTLLESQTIAEGEHKSADVATDKLIQKTNANLGSNFTGAYTVETDENGVVSVTYGGVPYSPNESTAASSEEGL